MSATQPAPDRRAVLGGSLGLAAVVAATALPIPSAAASGESNALLLRVDQAAARYHDARAAYAAALAAHEADLPRLHSSLDLTHAGGMHFGIPGECGHFNAYVKRGISRHGPIQRRILTVEVLQSHIDDFDGSELGGPRLLRRLRRRARKYEAAMRAAQQRHRLDELYFAKDTARSKFERLSAEVFEDPARTPEAMAARARVVCAIGACSYGDLFNRDWLLGQYGLKLAQAMQEQAAA